MAALDATSGEVVWVDPMPDGATRRGSASRGVAYRKDREREDARVAAPITYMADGKHYIVVAVGWSDIESEWVALALP